MKFNRFNLLFLSGLTILCASSYGWKPSMHAAIAEEARKDAIDGKVSITIFPTTTKLTSGIIPSLGLRPQQKSYPVDLELVDALKAYPEHYRAGTMGPDAYPDILTGQMVIHPDAPDNTVGGTNVWLEHIWSESLRLPKNTAKRLKARAFAAGYLTHGAGDMFGHTYVNFYAGGDFDTTSTNFLRHLVLEGYIGKRCPNLASTSTSIDGIEDWIYSTLVDCRKGTYLADRLYKGDKVERSIPYIFSKLRDSLAENINNYERHKDDLRRVPSAPLIAYQREWVKDIDAGLKAFPQLSHDIAQRMVLFDSSNLDEAKKDKELNTIVNRYVNEHLISMLGAPDFAGVARAEMQELYESILYSLISEEEIDEMKADLMDYIFSFTGFSYDQLKDYLKRPEFHFNAVMSANNRPRTRLGTFLGNAIDLNKLNAQLGIKSTSGTFDFGDFSPAYNTLVMSKLILLSPAGISQLMQDLGKPITSSQVPDNLILGYIRKFDGSAQWGINPEKMLLESKGVFSRIFQEQDGDNFTPDQNAKPIPDSFKVTVKIIEIRAISNTIDIGSDPDFYPQIQIGSEKKVFDAIDNKNVATSSRWFFEKTITGSSVKVRINIFDEDGNLAGDDDLCDANPSSNSKQISFDVNLLTKRYEGSITGALGQKTSSGDGADNVQVKFEVTVTKI